MVKRVMFAFAALFALGAAICLPGRASAAVYTAPAASIVKDAVGSPVEQVYHRRYYRRYYYPRRYYYRRYYRPRRYYYRPYYYRRYYRPGIYLRLF